MKILDRLPIPSTETFGFVGDERVRLKESAIIVWVSLFRAAPGPWTPANPIFPAILDTGHNHNFAIQHEHLVRWARVPPETLPVIGQIRHGERRLHLHAAKLWLHHNESVTAAIAPRQFRLTLSRGIAVYPPAAQYPRLPLLGLRAILGNRLHLAIDGEHASATLRTADWKTRLFSRLA